MVIQFPNDCWSLAHPCCSLLWHLTFSCVFCMVQLQALVDPPMARVASTVWTPSTAATSRRRTFGVPTRTPRGFRRSTRSHTFRRSATRPRPWPVCGLFLFFVVFFFGKGDGLGLPAVMPVVGSLRIALASHPAHDARDRLHAFTFNDWVAHPLLLPTPPVSDIEVDFADLTLDRKIGEGAFGAVYVGSVDHRRMAIKLLKIQTGSIWAEGKGGGDVWGIRFDCCHVSHCYQQTHTHAHTHTHTHTQQQVANLPSTRGPPPDARP